MSTLCLKCGYSVTEPICASCVIQGIKVWLHEQKIEKNILKKINNELNSLLSQIESLDYVSSPATDPWDSSHMQCTRCKKDMHLMCFYCVTNQVSQILKNNLKNKPPMVNFHESFNPHL